MKITTRLIQMTLAAALSLGLGSAASADDQTRNAIIGAGLGGVAGALLSEGDPLYTVGGAAAGGLLGHVLTDDKRDRKGRHWDRGRKRDHGYRHANYHNGKHGHKKSHKHRHHHR